MRRIAIVTALTVATLTLLFVRTASACSCEPSSPEGDAEKAVAVFVGVVRGFDELDGLAGRSTTFFVERVYKGALGAGTLEGVLHETQGPSCGLRFPVGARYTVFAYRSDGAFRTNSCWATTRGVLKPKALGLPAPGLVVPAPPVTGGWIDAWPVFALAMIAVLGIAVWFLRRRHGAPV